MSDATGVAEAMLGLPGFRVLGMDETPSEVVTRIETIADLVGCAECGVVAVAQDRVPVDYRDLAAVGRPARLVWRKRRWRCEERCQDLDRGVGRVLGALPAHQPRRRGVLSSGRAQRAPYHPDGPRAGGLLGHGDGRRA